MNRPHFKLSLATIIFLIFSTYELHAQLVVVVHPENPISNLSMDELKMIYTGKVSNFQHGENIVLTQTKGLTKEFYGIVLKKTPNKVLKYWINLVFSGVSVTPPLECRSEEDTITTVINHIGAIGFIEYSNVDERVKKLTLDGINPGDTDYPLYLK